MRHSSQSLSGSEEQPSGGSTLGALGVVFGDIGTSPLYAISAAFWLGNFAATKENVLGVVSLIVWAVTLIVSIKYVMIMMRADNNGEGGIMALVALITRSMKDKPHSHAKRWAFVGLVGVALFYGDSAITPAISVLSAVEGVRVALPALAAWTVPIALVALVALFAMQSRGTAQLGRLFGPIMVLWFVCSAGVGGAAIMNAPEVLQALSPVAAFEFIIHQPMIAFVALGAVVLSVTGAEALYADMGHFGRGAVRRGWFMLVYPALLLNYLGQGAFLLTHPQTTNNIYFWLYPSWAQGFVVILATLATLIASQSVITGAFSLTRQAIQLRFLPQFRIRHTSESAGQIYIPSINWLMLTLVAVLVVAFGSSVKLSNAFGMAESGTLLASTILLLAAARYVWPRGRAVIYGLGSLLLAMEGAFVLACSMKFIHGAWVPIAIASAVLVIFTTWARGSEIVSKERRRREGPLGAYIANLSADHNLVRTKGTAIYLAHHPGYTPLALRATVERLHELSESVVVVTVKTANVPHIALEERAAIDELGDKTDGVVKVVLTFGFNEVPNVPLALKHLHGLSPELNINPETATYFISESDIALARHGAMSRLQARLFTGLHRISAPSPDHFRLPTEQTIDMASYVKL